jgi:hypothetical protein
MNPNTNYKSDLTRLEKKGFKVNNENNINNENIVEFREIKSEFLFDFYFSFCLL